MAKKEKPGGNWIMTFADMITLLLAGFILIVTFSSRDVTNLRRRQDALVGKGGTGVSGKARLGPERDSVTLRLPPQFGRPFADGSEMPALYSDSPEDFRKAVRAPIEAKELGGLSDSFEIRLPIEAMFDGDTDLSPHGRSELERLARTVHSLPYELNFQVGNAGQIPRSVAALEFLFREGGIHPARMGVGVRPDGGDVHELSVTLRRQTR